MRYEGELAALRETGMTGPRVTVIGEALIDVVATRGQASEHVGGSPLNVAVTLGRLGDTVELITALGPDAHGDSIRRHLRESAVTLHTRTTPLASTSTAQATTDGDGDARYAFDLSWRLDKVPPPNTEWVHTGSIGAWLLPGADVVRALLGDSCEGSILSLDPNIRTAVIDGDADGVRARLWALLGLVDVVKLSAEDALWLFDDESHDVLDEILALGPSLAVLTRGEDGSVLQSAAGRVEVAALDVDVRDTIGAGDAYMGALIHATSRTRDSPDDLRLRPLEVDELRDIGDFAARIAGLTVARQGADPPWASDLVVPRGSAAPLMKDIT